jgi:hypothetical protein
MHAMINQLLMQRRRASATGRVLPSCSSSHSDRATSVDQ